MRRTGRRGRLATLAATAALTISVAAPAGAAETAPETIFGVTVGTNLVSFTTESATLVVNKPITGLQGGETVVSLDFRPATGELYGLTSNKRLVKIDIPTGAATALGSPLPFTGTADIGFNPAVDAIRLVSTDENNLRVNPNTGAVAGVDTNLGVAGNVAGAAYTNDVAGANATTLYDLDAAQLFRQGGFGGSPSPNGGALTAVGTVTPARTIVGGAFDISPATGRAFALALNALVPPGPTCTTALASCVFEIDLDTGASTDVVQTVTGLGATTIAPPAAALSFSSSLFGAGEADGNASVTVRRTGSTQGGSTVNYAFADGTAGNGTDYTGTNGTVSFAPGETTKTISVPIANDGVVEPAETFTVTLSGQTGSTLTSPTSATVSIYDNDVAATTTPGATDKTPPAVLVRATSSLKLKSLLKGLSFATSCSERCTLSGRLLLGSTVLGTFTATVNQAGVVNGTLRVSSAGRKALAKRLPKPKKAKKGRKAKTVKPAALVLEVIAVDAVGLKARSSTRVVVAR